MYGFLPTRGRTDSYFHDFTQKEQKMKKLTFEQINSLYKDNVITQEKYEEYISDPDLEIFKYRNVSADRPDSVQLCHSALIRVIKANAADLYNDGYRPAIMWKRINETEDETPDYSVE